MTVSEYNSLSISTDSWFNSGVFDSQSFVVLLFVSKYESVKFGRIQFLQNQLSVDIERLLYSLTVISNYKSQFMMQSIAE
jgi:hypothetical protein